MNETRFVHCKRCTLLGQTQRLEVALDAGGLTVQCKKHGLVVRLTPASLAALLAHPPRCACCEAEKSS